MLTHAKPLRAYAVSGPSPGTLLPCVWPRQLARASVSAGGVPGGGHPCVIDPLPLTIQAGVLDTSISHRQRGGSPTPRQQDANGISHQLRISMTPSRHMATSDSPLKLLATRSKDTDSIWVHRDRLMKLRKLRKASTVVRLFFLLLHNLLVCGVMQWAVLFRSQIEGITRILFGDQVQGKYYPMQPHLKS